MSKTFNTTEYHFSHGHTPRGRGSWAFARVADYQRTSGGGLPELVWRNGTYTEAKAALPAGDWVVMP